MVLGHDEANKALEAPDPERRVQVRRAALASAIGTTIEWYDFFLYNTAAALIFPHLFFPASSSYAGAMQSFATYAVGFAARPIGAATATKAELQVSRNRNRKEGALKEVRSMLHAITCCSR